MSAETESENALEENSAKPNQEQIEKEPTQEIMAAPSKLSVASANGAKNDDSGKDDANADDAPNESEIQASSTAGETAYDHAEGVFADYEQHVNYAADGGAIYTDPSTKQKYKWCNTKNNWEPITAVEADKAGNLYENEHYKWCNTTKQWLLKDDKHETEHYKWDAVQEKWLLKEQSQPQPQTPQQSSNANVPNEAVVSYNEKGERIYTDKDGTVFMWDESKSAWFPNIDEDFMARYQMNYGFIDNTSASAQERVEREAAEAKRKQEELERMTAEAEAAMNEAPPTSASVPANKRKAQEPPKWFDLDQTQNTKVYVSNLPLDITIDEFAELMGKCGMVMRDPATQKYKVKLYMEKDGQIKGDGLCDYIKVESVNLALKILDEYNLRGHKIRVQRAQFQMRGEYNPALKPKRKKKDKEKMQKLKEKLFDWRPDKMRGERSKNEKTVIIKNLFTPELFEKQVELILEYQNNLREECSKCGIVRKVVIYDRHPEGVAQVNMSSPEEADVVIQMMQGRYFGQRQLAAEHWDGKTKYKIDESATEVQQRLSKWDEYLAEDAAKDADEVADNKEEESKDGVEVKVENKQTPQLVEQN